MANELFLDGPVGDEFDAGTVRTQLTAMRDEPLIKVLVNSPGGSAFAGLSIYQQLKQHPARIEVVIDGLAASAAAVLAMGGTTVAMASTSLLMIHRASALTAGNGAAHQKSIEALRRVDGSIARAFADKTGKPIAEIERMLDAETWMTAEEAVAQRFADAIVEPTSESATPQAMAWDVAAYDYKFAASAIDRLREKLGPEAYFDAALANAVRGRHGGKTPTRRGNRGSRVSRSDASSPAIRAFDAALSASIRQTVRPQRKG
ncbi:MAG: head maturation protease, ClpP-related [Planctomycetota bacterium]